MAEVKKPVEISAAEARRIWLHAQRLDTRTPFGAGPEATTAAVEHLGYVQIDTINVIERCHHHILFSRIPDYKRSDLGHAQSVDKTVFEYWTHALSYVPTRDIGFYLDEMKHHRSEPLRWYADADPDDLKKLLRRIRKEGGISIRDIEGDELVEKDHPWASRKPSKRVLQYGFYSGHLTISERNGMVKTYELMDRHFGWPPRPKAATERQIAAYKLDRALRSQALINTSSVLHQKIKMPADIAALIETRVRKKELVPVTVAGHPGGYWATPAALQPPEPEGELVHILSPFDPLIIQRKRTRDFFGYDHVFEAYVPKAKRQFGYFTLPVLVGDEIVAVLDLKTDRAAGKMLIQAWHWVGVGSAKLHKAAIEEELGRFERFQLGG
ncbi:MAG TPA: crosslink repair DNA glycosylase YcaQ family protein [Devosia sp.]